MLFDEAMKKYEESLYLKPDDYRSLINMGLSRFLQGRGKVCGWEEEGGGRRRKEEEGGRRGK
jgi:hypothetical protein